MKFVFHDYYCNHCQYNLTGECCYPNEKDCSCYYERGVQQKEHYFHALELEKEREEEIINQLVESHDRINFYRSVYQESKARVDEMIAIDATYAKKKG